MANYSSTQTLRYARSLSKQLFFSLPQGKRRQPLVCAWCIGHCPDGEGGKNISEIYISCVICTGLVLVPEWDAKTEIDLRSVIVEEVKAESSAEKKGISKGDEVVLMNDKSVMELGWVEVERLMSGEAADLKNTQQCGGL